MADRTFTIKLGIDRGQAAAAAAAAVADLTRVQAAGRQAAQGEEAAAQQATRSVDRLRDSHGRFVAGMRDSVAVGGQATAAHSKGFFDVSGAVAQAAGSIEGMIGQFAAMLGPIAIVKMLVGAYDEVNRHALEAAEQARSFIEAHKELATLQGITQPGDVVPGALDFMMKTALPDQAANEFTRKFQSSLFIGLQKGNITKEVSDEFMVQAGQMAARQGGAPGTRGDLAGILGMFGKVPTAEAGLGQLEAIRIALTEGRGDDTPLTQQLLKVAGANIRQGGALGSLPEMAALIGVTSLSAGPEEAGTRAEQLIRGLKAGQTKYRKTPGMEHSEGQATYLKGLGITEDMDLEQMLAKIAPDLLAAQAGGRDMEIYLAEHGFRGAEERRSLIEVVQNYDIFKERIAKSRTAQSGAAVAAENAKYMKEFGQGQIARNAVQAATVMEGGRFGDYATLLKQVEAERIAGHGDTSLIQSGLDIFGGITQGKLSFAGGREVDIQKRAYDRLYMQAQKMGLPTTVGDSFFSTGSYAEEGRVLMQRIKQAGGNPLAGGTGKVEDLLREGNELVRAQQAPAGVPVAIPAGVDADGPGRD